MTQNEKHAKTQKTQKSPKTVHTKFTFYKIALMEKIAFCVITFEPIKIQTHSAPQNDRLNFSFVKVDGGNLALNSCKTAICQSTFFRDTL